jgi:hypothetical protein
VKKRRQEIKKVKGKKKRQRDKLRGWRMGVERVAKPLNTSVIPIPNLVCYLIPLSATAHVPWKVCNLPLT